MELLLLFFNMDNLDLFQCITGLKISIVLSKKGDYIFMDICILYGELGDKQAMKITGHAIDFRMELWELEMSIP